MIAPMQATTATSSRPDMPPGEIQRYNKQMGVANDLQRSHDRDSGSPLTLGEFTVSESAGSAAKNIELVNNEIK